MLKPELTPEEFARLVCLADTAAIADLELVLTCHGSEPKDNPADGYITWFDLSQPVEDMAYLLDDAMWWLIKRDRLIRHPDNKNLVRCKHGYAVDAVEEKQS